MCTCIRVCVHVHMCACLPVSVVLHSALVLMSDWVLFVFPDLLPLLAALLLSSQPSSPCQKPEHMSCFPTDIRHERTKERMLRGERERKDAA